MTEEIGWNEDAAAPAGTAASVGAPPAVKAGAATTADEGTGVPAGSPVIELDPEAPPADAVMLKVADPHSEFQVLDAVVTPEYRPFDQQQAAALVESAAAAGVTLINQADEEESGGTTGS